MKLYNINKMRTAGCGCEHETCPNQGFFLVGELSEDGEDITGYISCGMHTQEFEELLFFNGVEAKVIQFRD